tara:strand:- start:218 stop:1351 length:1134 start_codon:yes stop_codon:yes gene_type:complete
MAIFSGKITSAKFVDEREKTIEVLYKQTPDANVESAYFLEINYNNQDFLDLLKEYSMDQLHDSTRDYYAELGNQKYKSIEKAAEIKFLEWVHIAQKEIDEQDRMRYELFEKYKEEQLGILQAEADAQVERRVQEGYEGIQEAIDQEYKNVQSEVDSQVEIRIGEGYRDIQAEVDRQISDRKTELQKELDEQVERRYKEADEYKEEELAKLEAQVQQRIAEGFEDVEAYREKQLEVLQAEVDLQIKQRYEDADAYKQQQLQTLQIEIDEQIKTRYKEVEVLKDTEIKNIKQNFMDKFRLGTIQPNQENLSPENATKLLVSNMQDEDTVFKTKLVIFNLPEIKNHKDRKLKMKVRKAKTVPELFSVYYEMTNDLQHTHS